MRAVTAVLLLLVVSPLSAQIRRIDLEQRAISKETAIDVREALRAARGLSPRGGATCVLNEIDPGDATSGSITSSDCDGGDGFFFDFFDVFLFSGDTVFADALGNAGLAVFILNPAQDIIDFGEDPQYATAAAQIDQTGTWTIAVGNSVGFDFVEYVLSLTSANTGLIGQTACTGGGFIFKLGDGRFLAVGFASRAGNLVRSRLQPICEPNGSSLEVRGGGGGFRISQTATAFYFNSGAIPVQEGFLSIRDECPTGYKIEIASASTRRFWIDVLDLVTGIYQRYENPQGGSSSFFPADIFSFANACP